MYAYLTTCHIRPDGTKDTFHTHRVPVRESPLWWQEEGLSYTASGYGARIPTRYKVQFNGRWRRVYCKIFSNIGTLFIGKKCDGSAVINDTFED